MKTAKQILLIAFLLLQSIPALAANWELVGELSNGDQWYIETESLRRKANSVECWVSTNFAQPQTENNSNKIYQSNSAFCSYDCDNWTTRAYDLIYYSEKNRSGEVVRSLTDEKGFQTRVVPGSISEALMKFACKLSKKK